MATGLGAVMDGDEPPNGRPASATRNEREHQMIRKLKFLGLALAAVFAMSAVGASAASALVQFHTEGAPVTITANQHEGTNGFDVQFGEVKCTTAKLHGTTQEKTTETTITLTPTYEGCTFAGVATTIDMNGCDYTAHVHNLGPPYTGFITIKCVLGSEITVTGGNKCTVHVPAQTNLGTITYTNTGSGSTKEITVHLNGIQNITYTQTKGTAAVGACATMTTGAGKYTGKVTITGETDPTNIHTGIWIE